MLPQIEKTKQAEVVNSRPMKANKKISAAFASRLTARMRERGLLSPSARSGVDVGALAAAVGISYEMARRYAEGLAIPRPDKLAAIADFLGVTSSWLLWGEAGHGAGSDAINMGVLEECLLAISESQRQMGMALTSEQMANLAAMLYAEVIDGRPLNTASVARLVRMMSAVRT